MVFLSTCSIFASFNPYCRTGSVQKVIAERSLLITTLDATKTAEDWVRPNELTDEWTNGVDLAQRFNAPQWKASAPTQHRREIVAIRPTSTIENIVRTSRGIVSGRGFDTDALQLDISSSNPDRHLVGPCWVFEESRVVIRPLVNTA